MKAALAKLQRSSDPLNVHRDLEEMLFYRWAELDPVAANAEAKARYPERFATSRKAVIAAWINQGGAIAAWNAVKNEGDMWDCTQSVGGEVADMLVASLSDVDDATAFREVKRFDDENCGIAHRLCEARAAKAAETPEARASFLAAAATHPDPYVISCARDYLFKEWAKRDAEEARAAAMAMTLDYDARQSVLWKIESVKQDAERANGESR
ncbi:hypothetical protein OKA04_19765 [Luteolibacter flavescens]|uniref:Uncharacterized protein n=1 Tax=Luteolibacter flavescens TaxID=1859460 RepID=A0ABT3FUS8_9BACT|nr:hypothetical protein [Luteolibacter flavescens]MCW1886986.1 hypothetical protein [Luteolibacter flavescens]